MGCGRRYIADLDVGVPRAADQLPVDNRERADGVGVLGQEGVLLETAEKEGKNRCRERMCDMRVVTQKGHPRQGMTRHGQPRRSRDGEREGGRRGREVGKDIMTVAIQIR